MKFEGNKLKVSVVFRNNEIEYETEAIIDTGATITVIPPEISDFLNLEIDKETPIMKLITASGIIEVSRKIVKEIRIGGLIFKNIPAAIHKLPDPIEIKVLIGMNVIENLKLITDGKNKEFEMKL